MGENELVGQSAAMRDVRRLIDIAAPTKTTILIKERRNWKRTGSPQYP